MFRTYKTLLVAAVFLTVFGFVSCGGGDDAATTPNPADPAQLVPEVQVQVVDHNFRVAGWTHDILDADPIFELIGSATSSLYIAATRINQLEME